MRSFISIVLAALYIGSAPALACDPDTGERRQMISASWGGTSLIGTMYPGDDLVYFDLPSGRTLGVRTRPVSDEVYREQAQWRKFNVELVHLEFYDGDTKPRKLIAQTIAGANTSSEMSAKFLPGFGDERLRVELWKSVCVPTGRVVQKEQPSGT